MTFFQYLILMCGGTALSWLAWTLILVFINPFEAGFTGFFLFYISLFFALVGAFSTLGLIVRLQFKNRQEPISIRAARSLRQGIFLSILVVGLLFLHSKHMLNWWITILFIITLTLLEFFFLAYKNRPLRE